MTLDELKELQALLNKYIKHTDNQLAAVLELQLKADVKELSSFDDIIDQLAKLVADK